MPENLAEWSLGMSLTVLGPKRSARVGWSGVDPDLDHDEPVAMHSLVTVQCCGEGALAGPTSYPPPYPTTYP